MSKKKSLYFIIIIYLFFFNKNIFVWAGGKGEVTQDLKNFFIFVANNNYIIKNIINYNDFL